MAGPRSAVLSAVVFLAVSALLLAPSLVLGTMISHSSPQNLTWAGQFAEQFRAGVLYPRWLADSFDRLGGPAFYFYPPIGFWVDALLSVVTFDAFSVSYRLSLSSVLLLWASGLAMQAWLKTEAASPRAALYGALAYMAAPYHLIDHYYRGAYAEFAAYAVLPLVALGIRQVADDRRFAIPLLAVSYAALPMAHLPTSLLISLTLVPLYVLFLGWRAGSVQAAMRFFLRCAVGGGLGLALATIYLVPALTLQDWIPVDDFWTGGYRIETWFLFTPWRWLKPTDMMEIVASVAMSYAVCLVGVLALLVRKAGGAAWWHTEAAFWSFLCLLCLLLVAGALPWFWQIPFVAKVQFPWRLMIVVEFAVVTALCAAPWPQRSLLATVAFVVAIVAMVPGLAQFGPAIRLRMEVSMAEKDVPADLKQFLPAAYPQKPNSGYAELSLDPMATVPPITCLPEPKVCRTNDRRFGDVDVEIDSQTPTTVTLRRFAFPVWQLDPPLPIAASDPLQLVTFVAPAGARTYHVRRVAVRAEKIGWTVSAAALVILAGALMVGRRRRPAST